MGKKSTTTNARGQKVALVIIDCPVDAFDVEGAYIERRKRVPMWQVDDVKESKSSEEVYEKLAQIIPRWHGVVDMVDGSPLANPEDDHMVFSRLDMFEQFAWIMTRFQVNPKNQYRHGRALMWRGCA